MCGVLPCKYAVLGCKIVILFGCIMSVVLQSSITVVVLWRRVIGRSVVSYFQLCYEVVWDLLCVALWSSVLYFVVKVMCDLLCVVAWGSGISDGLTCTYASSFAMFCVWQYYGIFCSVWVGWFIVLRICFVFFYL